MNDQAAALAAIHADIQRAARVTALEWPNVIDADDAEQEIVLLLLSDAYAVTAAGLDEKARLRVLVKIGAQIASRYRGEYETFSGNVMYSTKEVRKLLDGGALTERGDRFDPGRADVQGSLADLSDDHRAILRARYAEGAAPSDARSRKQLQRAVDALTELMNRVRRKNTREHDDGPGSRKAISNEQARRLSRQHA